MLDIRPLTRLREESSDPANPPAGVLRDTLLGSRRIVVVGLSRDLEKPSRRVPAYLATKGYDVVPVNPHTDRVLGRTSYPSLGEVEGPVDLVLVFRPPEAAAAVVDEAATRPERPAIWLQEGIRSDEAVSRARASGLTVIQDLCIFKIHRAMEVPAGMAAVLPGESSGESPLPG